MRSSNRAGADPALLQTDDIPLTDAEISMILDTYMYTNYEYAEDGQSLTEIVEEMPEHIDVEETYAREYEILKKAVQNPQVGELTIADQSRKMGYNEGTNACLFQSADRSLVYVVFRGTADGEWLDNGRGLTESATKQQEEALRYFDEVMEREQIAPWQRVIPTGHSKGANKVQYITMESAYADLIDRCYAVDGQGFSEKAIAGWKEKYDTEEYDSRVGKIYGINGENDFVSVLGTSLLIPSHILYVKTPSEKTDFAAYHDITRMFATETVDEYGNRSYTYNGRKNPYAAGRGTVSRAVAGISDTVMALPPFLRDGCAASLMQLVECLNGGKKLGVNGELVTLPDLAEFQEAGIPAIVYSLFGKGDGLSFLKELLFKEGFVKSFGAQDDLCISYTGIRKAGELLVALSAQAGACIGQAEAAGLLLPFTIDDITVKRAQLTAHLAALSLYQKKLLALAGVLEGVASLYQGFDAG